MTLLEHRGCKEGPRSAELEEKWGGWGLMGEVQRIVSVFSRRNSEKLLFELLPTWRNALRGLVWDVKALCCMGRRAGGKNLVSLFLYGAGLAEGFHYGLRIDTSVSAFRLPLTSLRRRMTADQ